MENFEPIGFYQRCDTLRSCLALGQRVLKVGRSLSVFWTPVTSMASTKTDPTLWEELTEVRVNPLNGKCTTLPILSLGNQYSRNFHL